MNNWYNLFKISKAIELPPELNRICEDVVSRLKSQWLSRENIDYNYRIKLADLFGKYNPQKDSYFSKNHLDINSIIELRVKILMHVNSPIEEKVQILAEIGYMENDDGSLNDKPAMSIDIFIDNTVFNNVTNINKDLMFDKLLNSSRETVKSAINHELIHLLTKWTYIDRQPKQTYNVFQNEDNVSDGSNDSDNNLWFQNYMSQESEREPHYKTIQDLLEYGILNCDNLTTNNALKRIQLIITGINKNYPYLKNKAILKIYSIINYIDNKCTTVKLKNYLTTTREIINNILRGK